MRFVQSVLEPRATDVADFMSTVEPKMIEVATAVSLDAKSVMKRARKEINFTPLCPNSTRPPKHTLTPCLGPCNLYHSWQLIESGSKTPLEAACSSLSLGWSERKRCASHRYVGQAVSQLGEHSVLSIGPQFSLINYPFSLFMVSANAGVRLQSLFSCSVPIGCIELCCCCIIL